MPLLVDTKILCAMVVGNGDTSNVFVEVYDSFTYWEEMNNAQNGAQGGREEDNELPLFHVKASDKSPLLRVTVTIEQQEIPMEVDTGVALSLVSETTYKELWPDRTQKLYSYYTCNG